MEEGGFSLGARISRMKGCRICRSSERWRVSRNLAVVLLGEPIVDPRRKGSRRFRPTNGGDVGSFGAIADGVHQSWAIVRHLLVGGIQIIGDAPQKSRTMVLLN